MKDFLEGLAALLNVKAEDVSELFDTEGNAKEGVDLLAATRNWVKTRTDDVYKAAQRKTAGTFESWVKSQGFESDAQGTDLLSAYVESVKTAAPEPGKGGEWEKKYNDLLPKVEKLTTILKEKDAAIEAAVKDGQRREVAARLMTDVRKALGDKWAGSEDHFGILMRNYDLDRIRYENGVPVLLDESGEPMKDELHRPVAFEDDVKRLGGLIGGFHAVDPKLGGPPAPNEKGKVQTVTIPSGMTDRQWNEMYAAESDPSKRKAMLDAKIAQIEQK